MALSQPFFEFVQLLLKRQKVLLELVYLLIFRSKGVKDFVLVGGHPLRFSWGTGLVWRGSWRAIGLHRASILPGPGSKTFQPWISDR
ncbi:MAG: hypothetical protein ABFD10_22010 [Prolixibacteraceae bacterium]